MSSVEEHPLLNSERMIDSCHDQITCGVEEYHYLILETEIWRYNHYIWRKENLTTYFKKPIRTYNVAEMLDNHFCYGNSTVPPLCIAVVIHLAVNSRNC